MRYYVIVVLRSKLHFSIKMITMPSSSEYSKSESLYIDINMDIDYMHTVCFRATWVSWNIYMI